MTVETRVAPKNSLLLITDRETGEIPESMDGKLVASTPSCIAVGTKSEADGETHVTLTDEKNIQENHPGLRSVFRGVLATPNKEVHVCTVNLNSVLKLPVSSTQSVVEVWSNHETEPTELRVLVGPSKTWPSKT